MRYLSVAVVILLSTACKHRDYATSTGLASVSLAPVDGEGFTIDEEGLDVFGTDTWNLQTDAYDQRSVAIQDTIPSTIACIDGDVWLEVDVVNTTIPTVFFESVVVSPASASATSDEPGATVTVDDWSGDWSGTVEYFFGDDNPCTVPETFYNVDVHWELDESSWTEVKTGVGEIWPPLPPGA
jgi:hypothetical protein